MPERLPGAGARGVACGPAHQRQLSGDRRGRCDDYLGEKRTMIGGAVDPVGTARKELLQLFPDDEGFEAAASWARAVLESEGLDPDAVSLRSVRALRRHDRRLSRVAARYLADKASGKEPRGGGGRFNPLLK